MGAQVQMINLRMSGTNSTDIWDTGVWLGRYGSAIDLTEETVSAYLTAAITPLTTFWTGIRTYICPYVDWTSASAYAYEIGGSSAVALGHVDVEAAAGASERVQPPQVAHVASLQTASPTRHGRGRMYLPINGLLLSTLSGQCNAAAAGDVATKVQTLLNALNDLDFDGAGPLLTSVYSRTQSIARPITSVRVDSRPDVQRRRANAILPEESTTLPVS